MTTEDEEQRADAFFKAFREQLHHVDDFVQVVLNGHLEIEGELDSYLKRIFAQPQYLQEARLSFYEKMNIARAYTPVSHGDYEWTMMGMVNAMRNKIAHRGRHEVVTFDVKQIKELMLRRTQRLRDALRDADPKEVMVYAAAICSGYLSVLEEQLARHQGTWVDEDEDGGPGALPPADLSDQ